MSEMMRVGDTVDPIAEQIVALHGEVITAARTSIEKAIQIGELLAQKKGELPHGKWLPWVKALPFSQRTTWRYMEVFDHRHELEAKLATMASLNDAYKLIASKAHQSSVDDGYAADTPWRATLTDQVRELEGLVRKLRRLAKSTEDPSREVAKVTKQIRQIGRRPVASMELEQDLFASLA